MRGITQSKGETERSPKGSAARTGDKNRAENFCQSEFLHFLLHICKMQLQ